MSATYKPIYINRDQSTELSERYIENICHLNNIAGELCGTILFAIQETKAILFGFSASFSFSTIKISAEVIGNMFKLTLVAEPQIDTNIFKDEIELHLTRKQLAREFFIIKKLADEFEIMESSSGVILCFYNFGFRYERVMERIESLKSYWEQKTELKRV